jgi:hypothetical protein
MGSRIFVVSDWRRTRCRDGARKGGCADFLAEGKCGHQRPFPIPHVVSVLLCGEAILSATCRQGRKPGGSTCPLDKPDKRCRHVEMAIAHILGTGKPDDPIETSMVYSGDAGVPKCPNCRGKWGVVELPDGRFSCRSPTCARQDKHGMEREFVFERGGAGRPPPRRGEWVVSERRR